MKSRNRLTLDSKSKFFQRGISFLMVFISYSKLQDAKWKDINDCIRLEESVQKKRKRVNLLCDWILFYVLVTLHCVLWSEHTTCLWQMFIKEWPDARSRWRPCGWCQNISTSDLIAIWTGPRHSDSDKDLTWASRASQISSSVSSASFSCSHAREPSQRRWELKLVFFFELTLTTWVFWGRHVWEEVVI